MKATFKAALGRRMIQATLGAVLATGLLAAGSAYADGPTYTSIPQEPTDYVLTVLGDPAAHETTPITGLRAVSSPAQGSVALLGPTKLKAGVGCSIQCITSGVAYARGPGAELRVKTDTLARIWIHVTGPNGYNRTVDSGASEVTQFNFLFDDMEAGTTYQASVTAKDKQNYESTRSGHFTTFTRNVEIGFTNADLIERAYGNSDFNMGVWLDNAWDDNVAVYNTDTETSWLPLGIQYIQLDDVDRYLDLSIQLWEGTPNCNNLGVIDQPYFGPGSCSFMSFVSLLDGDNDLDARPADATSWTDWTLNRTMERPPALWLDYDPQLLFTVPVSLHVTYTPTF